MDYLINFANVVYLVAYFMRDIRWLRAFTVLAAGLLAAYFYLRPEPVMAAVYWNLFFGGLNAYQLLRLAVETPRRPRARRTSGPPLRRWARSGRLSPCS